MAERGRITSYPLPSVAWLQQRGKPECGSRDTGSSITESETHFSCMAHESDKRRAPVYAARRLGSGAKQRTPRHTNSQKTTVEGRNRETSFSKGNGEQRRGPSNVIRHVNPQTGSMDSSKCFIVPRIISVPEAIKD
ncbi:uncharacterized protein LOC144263173 isoform X2 [Eretmochelys imbricata]